MALMDVFAGLLMTLAAALAWWALVLALFGLLGVALFVIADIHRGNVHRRWRDG